MPVSIIINLKLVYEARQSKVYNLLSQPNIISVRKINSKLKKNPPMSGAIMLVPQEVEHAARNMQGDRQSDWAIRPELGLEVGRGGQAGRSLTLPQLWASQGPVTVRPPVASVDYRSWRAHQQQQREREREQEAREAANKRAQAECDRGQQEKH